MTTFSTGAALMDARLQGQARAIGLQRTYFDLREFARAKREMLDLTVNREEGALFIHVPKCAGTTIIRQKQLAHGHRSAEFFLWRDRAFFESVFKFSFVRNPYDRFVSAFHYLRSAKTSDRDGEFGRRNVGKYADFQDFAASMKSGFVQRRVLGWVHFIPQHYYICDSKDNILVNFIGRTENFSCDIQKINEKIGSCFENIRERAVPREDWRQLYTPETARYIREIYAKDFEIFGYEREI